MLGHMVISTFVFSLQFTVEISRCKTDKNSDVSKVLYVLYCIGNGHEGIACVSEIYRGEGGLEGECQRTGLKGLKVNCVDCL